MRWAVLFGAVVGWACADAPTMTPAAGPPASLDAVKFWDVTATTRWNTNATYLLQNTTPIPPNGQAWASRTLTYLSLAQYRAVQEATGRPGRASVSAAVARASHDVLMRFYTQTQNLQAPLVPGILSQMLLDEQSVPTWPGEENRDVALGDQLGAQIAREVWDQARTDGYDSPSTVAMFASLQGDRPVGEGYWLPAPNVPAVRSLWGVEPFFLETEDFLLSPPPPSLDGLQEAAFGVYEVMTRGSPAQLVEQRRIANLWNKVPPNGPFTAGEWNRAAVDLIQSYRRNEAQAARILFYANAAAFDAQIDCFMTKYTWWVARPAQLYPLITPVFTTPNHPSYPSAHSCISGAFGAMLASAFPDAESRAMLAALVEEAGLSRIYAGIHYPFDVEVGQAIGARAAAKAMKEKL